MKYNLVLDIDTINLSEFVENHPNGNIFQTPEMYMVYLQSKNYEPMFLAMVDEDNNIKASLLAVIQKEYGGILDAVTSRSIVFGGPLVAENSIEALGQLLYHYGKRVRSKAIYSQFRNQFDIETVRSIFEENEYVYEEHLNILVDLSMNEDSLWKDVHSKRRNEIRRATKEGTVFEVRNTEDDLKECYTILQLVYKRAKLPIATFEFFKNTLLQSNVRSGLRMFCAVHDNKIIGCMLVLVFKNTIYDFYAGADSKYYKKYPNDLIPWEVFLWGKENGYQKFDFGGAGKPNKPYGVRDYKKKFGGEFVNFGRFELIHKPFLFRIAKIGFLIWKWIR